MTSKKVKYSIIKYISNISLFSIQNQILSNQYQKLNNYFVQGEVIYVLKQVDMGPAQICSFVIGDACDDTYNPLHEWEVAFPPVNKPPVKPPVPPQEGAPTFKVLHISDTHYDPYYQEGANADCNEPLCCRLTNGSPLTPAAAAGRWGDYRKCDTPKRTVEHMLKHIVDTHSVSNHYQIII